VPDAHLALFLDHIECLVAHLLMAEFPLELSVLGHEHGVLGADVLVLLLVAVAAEKDGTLVGDCVVLEVDEVEEDAGLLVGGVVQH